LSRRGRAGDEEAPPARSEGYVANLRRELTRAQARVARAERERDAALAENAQLRERLEKIGDKA
jgi:hypothetical protein